MSNCQIAGAIMSIFAVFEIVAMIMLWKPTRRMADDLFRNNYNFIPLEPKEPK